MALKINQSQILVTVLTLTLGIIIGSIGYDKLVNTGQANPQNAPNNSSQVAIADNQNTAQPSQSPDLNQSNASIPVKEPEPSTATTTATLEISPKPEEKAAEVIKQPEVKVSETEKINPIGQEIQMKYLKIKIDNLVYTTETPFRDPKSKILDSETFALFDVTIENTSNKTVSLDGRAYMIEILNDKIELKDKTAEFKQTVFKPARELGPTFIQSKYTLIRNSLKPKQKFTGKVGFKIPKESTGTLNFYYPDVLDSKDIALIRVK